MEAARVDLPPTARPHPPAPRPPPLLSFPLYELLSLLRRGLRSRGTLVSARSADLLFDLLFGAFEELRDAPLGLLHAPSVAFAQHARELLGAALRAVEVVVGQRAPRLADLTLQLHPLAGQNVLVHGISLSSISGVEGKKGRT